MKKSEHTNKIWLTLAMALLFTVILSMPLFDRYLNPTAETLAPTPKASETQNAESNDSLLAATEKLQTERNQLLQEAEKLREAYYYDEALALLEARPDLADQTISNAAARLIEDKASLVKYDGPIYHIFFHSLIADTAKAFDGDNMSLNYHLWMTTHDEFQRILPQLYQRNYVLYNLDDLIAVDAQGKITQRDIFLPSGKIPLVISIDDVNYYSYMQKDGFAKRLEAGEDGRIYTVVTDEAGNDILTRDGDIMPILDDFVAEHPDFSYRGAKGVIALTGYEGALGYRITDLTGEELAAAKIKAKTAANVLKNNGWLFACHSYTHNQYFNKLTITQKQLESDTSRWKTYIQPITGETDIYISPFGVRFNNDDPRYRYIVAEGFHIFCPVERSTNLVWYEDNIVMPRINIDGFSMTQAQDYLNEHLFNVDEVLDPARPIQ